MTLYVDDPAVDATEPQQRYLCRFEDGAVFAYASRGKEFMRMRDHESWAVEDGEALVSARSGEVLAVRRGKVYFATETDEPLYYERAH
jgi:hypothetical protein